jgi:hypothetical protein
MGGVGMAGLAQAQTDVPAGVHNVSEHWTVANSPYRLKGQVYFGVGTTLTIDAGVIVANLPADQGSLAIVRGAQIIVNGTQANPVIMTSTNDVATWTGTTGSGSSQMPGNPKTGVWREAANEWGNLTIMGDAYISENSVVGNTPVPSPSNVANMEGLVNGPSTDQYGGGDDNDDSGSIRYLSLRYGGKVVGLANELNGLSLGGIGRNTDIDHVDIMNNVDDGIEIWGGTVNLKNFNIWNIGDDCFDVDQGWRGKAQFGLLVQGYSLDAAQGSGVGDNCFETDGAEDSSWQPVTTATIYNCTVIGQPLDGDHATAWRDDARVQYRNCIFMDIGERVVSFDNLDGDGASGYGFSGTLSWPDTWTTAFNAVPAHANDFTTGTYATNYPAQTSGRLAEITDSVFYNNNHATAYTEANLRDVFNPLNNNVMAASSPIQSLTRGPQVIKGGKLMVPVIGLDPRPANDALVSVNQAPNDGFFTPSMFRGAFVPNAQSWLCDWTASFAFGFTTTCEPGSIGCVPGQNGIVSCPCGNPPVAPGLGCNNFGAGPAASGLLQGSGTASISSDSVVLNSSGENNTSLSVFFGGSGTLHPTGLPSGAGLRCVSTALKRFYIGSASAGAISRPGMADPSITARAAALGVPISSGNTRHFYVAYRDPSAAGPCGNSASTINTTNSYSITWAP